MSYAKLMLLCTAMHVLAGIFAFGCCSEPAAGTGKMCTRSSTWVVLIHTGTRVDLLDGRKKCVSGHISTRAVLIHTGTRVDPLYWQNNAFSGHISTRAVLIYTGTRVKPPVLVFKLCFLCVLLSTD